MGLFHLRHCRKGGRPRENKYSGAWANNTATTWELAGNAVKLHPAPLNQNLYQQDSQVVSVKVGEVLWWRG